MIVKNYPLPLILTIQVIFVISIIEGDSRAYNKMELISRALKFNSKLNKSANSSEVTSRQIRQSSACFSNPCNTGQCYDLQITNAQNGGFYCVCTAGFSGSQCEIEINECLSSPCKNNAKCLDLVGSFFCACPTGFSGLTCEKSSQAQVACPPNVCGDGECVSTTHPTYQYACKCRDGTFKFEACPSLVAAFKCINNPCGSFSCVEAPNSEIGYLCQCGPNDFRPSTCPVANNVCGANVCGDGECLATTHPSYKYVCKCKDGSYKFESCTSSIAITKCSQNPCGNYPCIEVPNSLIGYLCQCGANDFRPSTCSDKEKSVCSPDPCGGGQCLATTHPTYKYVCKCADGSYKFESCSNVVTKRCQSSPCGTDPCFEAPTSPTGFVCACGVNDFRPSKCAQSVAATCRADSCLNGGACIPYAVNEPWCNTFQSGSTCCQCPTGYTGPRCETDINECVSNPCKNGGVCENLVNSFKCNCQNNFSGPTCEVSNRCVKNQCKFGGTCAIINNEESCICRPGFTGKFCETDINECQSSPCQNGGTCVDLENSYACYCPDGFFRPLSCPAITTTTVATTTAASVPVLNQCEPNPCKNQGTCITFTNGIFYSCFCQNGFTGKYCEFPPHSTRAYTTSTVSSRYSQSVNCLPNPCFNDGICHSKGCICPSGYDGYFCEKEIRSNLCDNIHCKMGTCHIVELAKNIFIGDCWCQVGFSGDHCEIKDVSNVKCSSTQCLNGGTCIDNPSIQLPNNSFCSCRPGFTGTRCETEYYKCTQNGMFPDVYGCEEGRYLECVHYGEVNIGFATGVLYRRDCPPGLRYNPSQKYCDYASNVIC